MSSVRDETDLKSGVWLTSSQQSVSCRVSSRQETFTSDTQHTSLFFSPTHREKLNSREKLLMIPVKIILMEIIIMMVRIIVLILFVLYAYSM